MVVTINSYCWYSMELLLLELYIYIVWIIFFLTLLIFFQGCMIHLCTLNIIDARSTFLRKFGIFKFFIYILSNRAIYNLFIIFFTTHSQITFSQIIVSLICKKYVFNLLGIKRIFFTVTNALFTLSLVNYTIIQIIEI